MQVVRDIFSFPSLGSGVLNVWYRNFLIFKHTILVTFFWVILEPSFYLLAIGYGLGGFVKEVDGMPYIDFYFPALLASTGMFIAFFESCYGSYTKLARQHTYQTMLLPPQSPSEILMGEILWGASKGFLSVMGVGVVALGLGLFHVSSYFPLIVLYSFLICWIFSAFGVLIAAYARNYDFFLYFQSAIVIPLSLFSGTFFPLKTLPLSVQKVILLFPLAHAVSSLRNFTQGRPFMSSDLLALIVLIVYSVLFTNWAVARMTRRLVH